MPEFFDKTLQREWILIPPGNHDCAERVHIDEYVVRRVPYSAERRVAKGGSPNGGLLIQCFVRENKAPATIAGLPSLFGEGFPKMAFCHQPDTVALQYEVGHEGACRYGYDSIPPGTCE